MFFRLLTPAIAWQPQVTFICRGPESEKNAHVLTRQQLGMDEPGQVKLSPKKRHTMSCYFSEQ